MNDKREGVMKILFVYPNIARAKSPQLGICMITAVARQSGHECAIYDVTTIPEGEEISAFKTKLEDFVPDVLAVSCRSNEWPFVKHLFQSVSLYNIIKVFGGPHATVAPEEVIEIADIVVIGEGEDTFSELLQKIVSGDDVSNTAGCWVRANDTIIKNEMRALISDLDELPFPYWSIFDDIHYRDSYVKKLFEGAEVVGTFEGSRGCPYACSYCTNEYVRKLYEGKGKWRREKSPERIVQEVRQFREEYGLDCVYWIDEVVLTNVNRLKRFRDLYLSEINTPFVFMERPENMTDEKIRVIKEMGAQQVSIGIESGDEEIRRNLLNRRHSQESIIAAFQNARRYGLTTHAFTMIGFPGEGKQSILETYRLLKAAQPDTVQTTIFFPIKRTKLYKQVVRDGLFDPQTPPPQSYYRKSLLSLPESQQKELIRYQYLLTSYDSRLMYFFAYVQPSEFVFRIFVFSQKFLKRFRKKG
jgi:radical SAM superfamily enzyme YgiQ (UPF0313 family)